MPKIDDERNPHPVYGQTEATVKYAVCNYNALLKAEKRAHRRVGYKNSVARFHMLAMSRTYELSKELYEESYRPQKGEVHEVFEPKHRITVSSKYRDRIAQGSYVTNFYYGAVIPNLEATNCACMKGRGVDYARKIMKEILRASNGSDWCVKVDMKSYFASIDRKMLLSELEKYVTDGWAMYFLDQTVRNASGAIGLDLGSEVYQLTATSFLDRLDKNFRGYRYVRYQDDFVIIGTRAQCKEFLREAREIAARLKLTISEKKTFAQPIKRPIRFLGFSFLRHPSGRVTMKRLPEKARNEKRKLKRMTKKGVPPERIEEHYRSVRACLKKGSRSGVCKMDRYYRKLMEAYDGNCEEGRGCPQKRES